MANKLPDWQLYERMIAKLINDQLATDMCVTPNAHITGHITGKKRQIDVVIDSRYDTDNTRRIIIDAKKRTRKIDVTHVEAFLGLMADVGATQGYLICPAGHTATAEKRAQLSVKIRLVPLDQIQDFDPSTWPKCMKHKCVKGRVFWDGYPGITLSLRPQSESYATETQTIDFVHSVGKCDKCGRFHVRCLSCNDIMSIPEDDENDIGHQCSCRHPWFWIASIESDEHGHRSAELHLVSSSGHMTTDRRPL